MENADTRADADGAAATHGTATVSWVATLHAPPARRALGILGAGAPFYAGLVVAACAAPTDAVAATMALALVLIVAIWLWRPRALYIMAPHAAYTLTYNRMGDLRYAAGAGWHAAPLLWRKAPETVPLAYAERLLARGGRRATVVALAEVMIQRADEATEYDQGAALDAFARRGLTVGSLVFYDRQDAVPCLRFDRLRDPTDAQATGIMLISRAPSR